MIRAVARQNEGKLVNGIESDSACYPAVCGAKACTQEQWRRVFIARPHSTAM